MFRWFDCSAQAAFTALWAFATCSALLGQEPVAKRALELHRSALVFDGHNDLPWQIRARGRFDLGRYDISQRLAFGHTDKPRLREGGVKAQFWSVFVPSSYAEEHRALHATLEQIDIVYRMVRRYRNDFELAYRAAEVERIVRSGKIACLIGIEGGHSIEESLAVLRMLYQLGARYMTLTHSRSLKWADSATDEPRCGGLSSFGRAVVLEMNRLGMLVDISHVSADTMRAVLAVTKAPVIASHSSAYAIAPHPRNVPDDVLKLIRDNGGVVLVNFYSNFIQPEAARNSVARTEYRQRLQADGISADQVRKLLRDWDRTHLRPRATLDDLLDHIDHIVRVAGIDHVGLGSDFDGIDRPPIGLEDVSCYPRITAGLLKRGYSPEQIRKILGANLLRTLRAAESVAAQLQSNRPDTA
ncbi:MAG TPA: membrane dipeptidase, partial [Planctomycetaceae bacterium]|nr:membrane dipeptidase [Planctomycetaceae bacterium]